MKRKLPPEYLTQAKARSSISSLFFQPHQIQAEANALFQDMQTKLNNEGFAIVFPPDFNPLLQSQIQEPPLDETKMYDDLVSLIGSAFEELLKYIIENHLNDISGYFNHRVYPETVTSEKGNDRRKKTREKISIVIYEKMNKNPIAFLVLKIGIMKKRAWFFIPDLASNRSFCSVCFFLNRDGFLAFVSSERKSHRKN